MNKALELAHVLLAALQNPDEAWIGETDDLTFVPLDGSFNLVKAASAVMEAMVPAEPKALPPAFIGGHTDTHAPSDRVIGCPHCRGPIDVTCLDPATKPEGCRKYRRGCRCPKCEAYRAMLDSSENTKENQ